MNDKKTLNESINEVMNAKVSDRTKKRSLVKLGLRQHEIEFIFAQAKVQGDFDFSKITFGVEIECYNVMRSELIENASRKGLHVRSEDYNHTDNKHYYKIVRDGSLTGENSQEVVSPILQGDKGLSSLETLCKALAEIDARVNVSCGLHVHVGAAMMSDEHYCRLVRNYQALEPVIDSFMPNSRRANNSRWCHSLRGIDFSTCTTKQEIAAAMNYDRYYKVNAQAYSRHQTIEFRQHSGTTDYTKISNWVLFLAKLVEYSQKNEISACAAIEEIPFLNDEQKQYFTNRRAALQ